MKWIRRTKYSAGSRRAAREWWLLWVFAWAEMLDGLIPLLTFGLVQSDLRWLMLYSEYPPSDKQRWLDAEKAAVKLGERMAAQDWEIWELKKELARSGQVNRQLHAQLTEGFAKWAEGDGAGTQMAKCGSGGCHGECCCQGHAVAVYETPGEGGSEIETQSQLGEGGADTVE